MSLSFWLLWLEVFSLARHLNSWHLPRDLSTRLEIVFSKLGEPPGREGTLMSSPVTSRPCLDLAISTLIVNKLFPPFSLVRLVISCLSYYCKKLNMALAHGLFALLVLGGWMFLGTLDRTPLPKCMPFNCFFFFSFHRLAFSSGHCLLCRPGVILT